MVNVHNLVLIFVAKQSLEVLNLMFHIILGLQRIRFKVVFTSKKTHCDSKKTQRIYETSFGIERKKM